MVINLCLQTDVSTMVDIVGRYSTAEIDNEIFEQTEFMYQDYGEPLSAIVSGVDRDENNDFYTRFYVGERGIYRVDDVFIGTATKRRLTSTTDYTTSTTNGMIKFTSATTIGSEDIDDSDDVEVWFVPGRFRKLCAIRTAEKLLQKSDTMSGAKTSKELMVIQDRRKEYEDLITNKNAMLLSSQFDGYDEFYDVNKVSLIQDYKRNAYIFP